MIGLNAGLIGSARTSRRGAAVGLWTPNEQVIYQRQNAWIGDINFDSVSLLLHMNGSNGSTTFADSSKNALTVTANGNAQISTAQNKFGEASAVFDGTGDYLSVTRNSAFLPVANEDFTFEAWIYMTATPGATDAQIMGFGEYGTDADWLIAINSSRQCYFYTNSNTTFYTNTTAIALNTWTHIAVSRSGTAANNLKVFINGVGQSFSNNVTTIFSGNRDLTIGADRNGDEANFTGYIDDLRITKGVGRYTANFTVPAAPFPDS